MWLIEYERMELRLIIQIPQLENRNRLPTFVAIGVFII